MKHIMETWNLYRYVYWRRRCETRLDDTLYYHCLEELEAEGLYDFETGVLTEWSEYLESQPREIRLEWVSCETEVMMETLGNENGLCDVYLSNDKGKTSSEWTMVGQNYENLATAHQMLERFVKG